MKNLNHLIGEQTYVVVDHPANRFNFCGMINIDESLSAKCGRGAEYAIASSLPEDAQRAVDTMVENGVAISDFTDLVVFKEDDEVHYILTW